MYAWCVRSERGAGVNIGRGKGAEREKDTKDTINLCLACPVCPGGRQMKEKREKDTKDPC